MNSRYFSIFSPLDFMLTRSTCFPWSVLACSRQPSALAARLCMAALHRGGPRAPRRRAVMMRAAAPGRTPVARCRFVTSRPRPTPHPPFPAAAVRLSRATWHAASRPNPWPGLATGLILPHCTVRTWRPAKLVRVPTDFVFGSFWLGWCSPSTIPFRTRFAHVQVRNMRPDYPLVRISHSNVRTIASSSKRRSIDRIGCAALMVFDRTALIGSEEFELSRMMKCP